MSSNPHVSVFPHRSSVVGSPSLMQGDGLLLTNHSSLTRGSCLIYGHPTAREVGFYMAAEWLCRGQLTGHPGSVVIIDGENGFDPFIFGDVARRWGLRPEAILHNIFVSRAFTCHQLQALIVERLVPVIRKTSSQIIIVLGLLTTFYDEQVPLWEARRLLRPTLGRLYGLAQRGFSILLLLPDEPRSIPKRQEFLKLTKLCAEKVFRIYSSACADMEKYGPTSSFGDPTSPSETCQVSVHQEKPEGRSGDWEIVFDPAMQPRRKWQNIR